MRAFSSRPGTLNNRVGCQKAYKESLLRGGFYPSALERGRFEQSVNLAEGDQDLATASQTA